MNTARGLAPALPIDEVLPALIEELKRAPNAVLRAPTGAGKTTRVPPALLDAGLASDGTILLLEPRRLAARAAARRIAFERGGRVGDEVGYHVRFDRQASRNTRILAVTPGIVLRMFHDDPALERISIVLFDEFHERGLESDLALGMIRLIQQTIRPELHIVAMSATLDTDAVARYLGNCSAITSEGRLHPVEIRWEPRQPHVPWPDATAGAIEHVIKRKPGDVLVFLAGMQEMRAAARALEPIVAERDLAVMLLHGDLPPEQQDAALQPQDRRKVILSTNVAETSVTVEGVTAVVDTGLARVLRFHAGLGLDRLEVEPISRASADQRAGRAGRTQPGICIRLWDEVSHRTRPEQTESEIRRVDLAGAVLQLLALGEKDVAAFPWLEAPPEGAVAKALLLLRRLGALGDDGLTELGHSLARLPVHPRIARMLLEGQRLGEPERVALAAALLSERSPFVRPSEGGRPRAARHRFSDSDVLDRVEALEAFESNGQIDSPAGTLHPGGAAFVLLARDQFVRLVQEDGARPAASGLAPDESVARALLAGFPDRVARRRNRAGAKALMVGGRGVKLAAWSAVKEADLFICVEVDAGDSESTVRQASAVQRTWLPSNLIAVSNNIHIDAGTGRITCWKRTRFMDLLLEETQAALPDGDELARLLADAATKDLERVLPPSDSAAGKWLTRVRCLRTWMPELGLPEFTDSELRELLSWVCAGCRSFDDVRRANWLGVLQGRLTHAQLQAIDREAPERIAVPSGSNIQVEYESGRPPVLAVRIQEIFGLADTPRVAGGRIKVLLHLLAPNHRPQQVTDDLASFWAVTYQTIRKELRVRYPKHAWPEDPWNTPAQRGPKRKGN